MIKDNYTPNIKDSNIWDKLSDKWLGTNKVHNTNLNNNYELQKAININKYGWNMEGMMASGINPMMASGNLSNIAASGAQSSQSQNEGLILGELSNIFKELSPSTMIREMRSFAKSFLKK